MTRTTRARDPRLDFFRGLGMFIILIAHITDNPWTLWIPARFGFSDATEIFVFCSGMASASAFGASFAQAGWALGTLRIGYRMWQVYWVHLGVFFATLTLMVALDASGIFPRSEVGALNLTAFLAEPGPNLIGLFTLSYVPNYFDILPMYLVVLALIPVMVALARWHVGAAVALSLGLWGAAHAGMNLPAEAWFSVPSARGWFFNPFAWQAVFFAGFALKAGWLPAPPVRRGLIWAALAVLMLSVPLAAPRIAELSPVLSLWRDGIAVLFDKQHLGVLRVVHFLALAYLAVALAGPGGARLRQPGPAGAAIALISRVGQQSLAVFAASMVMARALGAVLNLAGGGALATLAVNLAGFGAIIAVSRLAAYVKAKPWAPARG